jgi:hypothetical protein
VFLDPFLLMANKRTRSMHGRLVSWWWWMVWRFEAYHRASLFSQLFQTLIP